MEPDPLLGWTIARRRLDAVLGEGAQAVVYRATHVDLHRAEVVKILKQRSGNLSPERFAREARALASMSTEHVVQVHDYGQTADGEHFLVMELVAGDSLRDVLTRQGPVELVRALRIVEQLCLGLAEAHRLGIIHRDLKPDNVLLEHRKGATERVKIVDFGIAHDRRVGLTLPGRIFGTPGYLAPEQLKGQPLDARADLFAVGVLLYEMLAGFNPLSVHGANPGELLTAVAHRLSTPVTPLSTVIHGLPEAVDAFVNSLVALERNDRPDDAGAVALRAAELRFTVTGGDAPPELQALTDELSEQARQLAAERVAIEGRARALAKKQQAIQVAEHRLHEASRPPAALLPPQPTPPSGLGGPSNPPSGLHPHPSMSEASTSGRRMAMGMADASTSGRRMAMGMADASTSGLHRHPAYSSGPPSALHPAPTAPARPGRPLGDVVLAGVLVAALTATLAVLLVVAFGKKETTVSSPRVVPAPAGPSQPAAPGGGEGQTTGSMARR